VNMVKTKRTAALVVLTLFLLSIALAGCGGGAKPQSEGKPAEDKPVTGGTYVRTTIGDAVTLNPILTTDTASSDVTSLVHSALIKFDDKLNVLPDLATKWTVSPDGKVWTFELRKDVKWHDGKPFTAKDVKFTFESILHPGYTGVRASNYQKLLGAEEYQKALAALQKDKKDGKIKEDEYNKKSLELFEQWKAKGAIKIIDDYKIEFTLAAPYAPFLTQSLGMGIIPEHLLKDVQGAAMKDAPYNRAPIGTGPYKFKEWKKGELIVLEANPDYYGGRPYIDQVVFKVIPDQNTAMVALETGEVDMAGITPEMFDHFKKDVKNVNLYEYGTFSYTYMGYNLKNPLFQDKKVRQAFAYAVPRQEIVDKILLGHGQIANSHGTPYRWDYNPNVKNYKYDKELAKKMLDEAGWKVGPDGIRVKDGKKFSFTLSFNQGNKTREQAAVIIQQALKEVGIEVKTESVEWNTYLQRLDEGKLEAYILGWSLGFDPDSWVIWHTNGSFNDIGYSNPEVDKLLDEGRVTMDQNKRAEIYKKVQEILAEDQPYMFLFFGNSIVGLNSKLHGPITGTPAGIHWNFEKWWIPKDLQAQKTK